MTIPVIVATNPDRKAYVDHFMKDVPKKYRFDIVVCSTWGMELGALQLAHERLKLHESFVFLQDTMKVHDWDLFMDAVEAIEETAYILPRPCCYAMLYNNNVLDEMQIPAVGQDKELSIQMETAFCDDYESTARRLGYDVPTLFPEMTDGEALLNDRFYDGLDGRRLWLRSGDNALSKFKATFR